MTTRGSTLAGTPLSRRGFVRAGGAFLLAPSLLGCGTDPEVRDTASSRLSARPLPAGSGAVPGESPLGLEAGRDGLLYVPEGYDPSRAHPLFVALHGAGGAATNWRGFYGGADRRGMILLIPESRGSTWDRIRGEFGPDVAYLDAALKRAFSLCNVDVTRLCLAGFSDGASYALSLSVSNGDLFTHTIGFSPGFLAPVEPLVGKPRVYVSHGAADPILSVNLSRTRVVPWFQDRGYDVTYQEFDGGHEVPAEVGGAAADWFVGVS